MYQVGGKDWDDYYSLIKKQFMPMQQSNGSWARGYDGKSPGPVYQTSIAVLAISRPRRLPAHLSALI